MCSRIRASVVPLTQVMCQWDRGLSGVDIDTEPTPGADNLGVVCKDVVALHRSDIVSDVAELQAERLEASLERRGHHLLGINVDAKALRNADHLGVVRPGVVTLDAPDVVAEISELRDDGLRDHHGLGAGLGAGVSAGVGVGVGADVGVGVDDLLSHVVLLLGKNGMAIRTQGSSSGFNPNLELIYLAMPHISVWNECGM